ncbi:MAG: fused MFS/spermidine synthase [Chloroflexota bacterium]|nr:fused MFS/spermidine synthase [Chloroflexota bacterium]
MGAISEEIHEAVATPHAAMQSASRVGVGPLALAVPAGGAAGMVLEMTASRLLAPYFGSSLFIWADLIGLVMIFLTLGYTLGGRLADRAPRPVLLYGLLAAAGLAILAIPVLSSPVLAAVAGLTVGGTNLGALIGVIALFGLPSVLLGMIAPFAIRLRLRAVGAAGRTAGSLYALATLGSIVGTFATVFGLLPYLGIALTLTLAGGGLLLVAALGALVAGRRPNPPTPFPTKEGGADVATTLPSLRRGGVGGEVVTVAPNSDLRPQTSELATIRTPQLWAVVGVGGAGVMALEMTAAQLLRPYFGSSLFIWANLIGLVMIYLTLGYWLGGRLADRAPRPAVLYGLMSVAGLATAIIPLLAQPILTWSLEGFAQVSVGIFYGSLAGVIGLFAIPLVLLGMISPFAIRLRTQHAAAAGQTAGGVSSVSTLGSIIGTFVPVFLLLPNVGSGRTLLLTAGAVLLVATVGMLAGQVRGARLVGAGLLAVAALGLLPPPALIKPPPYGTMIVDRESVYNYIQVVAAPNGDTHLVLNEGHAVHSIYRADPAQPLTGGPWDYWLVAPYVNANMQPAKVNNLLMLGSAAGTASQLFSRVYAAKPVDNVELDPEIVKLGHQYFHLPDGNVHNIVQDARVYLRTTGQKYTIVGIDAYRQPYIPFHLTTREFFQETQQHLDPNGVVMINAGRTSRDFRLVDAIAATMRSVYPHVYIIDVANMGNSMVIGTMQADGLAHFKANAATATDPLLQQVFAASLAQGNMREVRPAAETGQPVFTDDRAPVEEVIDQLILNYVTAQ